jgi:hypothetical protein
VLSAPQGRAPVACRSTAEPGAAWRADVFGMCIAHLAHGRPLRMSSALRRGPWCLPHALSRVQSITGTFTLQSLQRVTLERLYCRVGPQRRQRVFQGSVQAVCPHAGGSQRGRRH